MISDALSDAVDRIDGYLERDMYNEKYTDEILAVRMSMRLLQVKLDCDTAAPHEIPRIMAAIDAGPQPGDGLGDGMLSVLQATSGSASE